MAVMTRSAAKKAPVAVIIPHTPPSPTTSSGTTTSPDNFSDKPASSAINDGRSYMSTRTIPPPIATHVGSGMLPSNPSIHTPLPTSMFDPGSVILTPVKGRRKPLVRSPGYPYRRARYPRNGKVPIIYELDSPIEEETDKRAKISLEMKKKRDAEDALKRLENDQRKDENEARIREYQIQRLRMDKAAMEAEYEELVSTGRLGPHGTYLDIGCSEPDPSMKRRLGPHGTELIDE